MLGFFRGSSAYMDVFMYSEKFLKRNWPLCLGAAKSAELTSQARSRQKPLESQKEPISTFEYQAGFALALPLDSVRPAHKKKAVSFSYPTNLMYPKIPL